MLRKIGLQNFKCWKELDIDLAPITLFFGSNSSGKTTILQSLLMLKQTARGFDPAQHINFGDDRDYVELGSYRDLVYGHDFGENVGVRLAWDTSTPIFSINKATSEVLERHVKAIAYDILWAIDENIYIDRLRYCMESIESDNDWFEVRRQKDGQYGLSSSFSDPDEQHETIKSPEKCYVVPWTTRDGGPTQNIITLLDINGEFERFVDKLYYIGPLRQRPERIYVWTGGKPAVIEADGANTIQSLIASERQDNALMSRVSNRLREMELVEDFAVKPIDPNKRLYEVTATIGNVPSSLIDVGFGISQVLPVIAMLFTAPKESIVLLEQPELHLHPKAQSALADLLLYVAETRKLQLIVESHSEHIVRRLQRRIAEGEPNFAKPENIKMYFCQTGQEGSTIQEVEIDRFGQIANWPEDFLGDISGDIHSMSKAAFERLHQERAGVVPSR